MPAPAIKSFAKKTGKSEAEVEKLWKEAKKAAGESYSETGDSEKFYGTAMKILKNKLNISEERTTFADYVGVGVHAHVRESKMEDINFVEAFLKKGRANEKGFTDKDADAKELEMGIKVEYEHTDNADIAKRIALDHLAEFPDYYTRLAKMEEEGKKATKDK